jgi:hypothetical protein
VLRLRLERVQFDRGRVTLNDAFIFQTHRLNSDILSEGADIHIIDRFSVTLGLKREHLVLQRP